MIAASSTKSVNWSGYAITGPDGSVTKAEASWIVPAIVGACPSKNHYSAFWVGIDGYSSKTVEQTGTDSDCQGGVAVYYAWYEFYPAVSHVIAKITVHPGDVISAQVTFASGEFKATIKDMTTGVSITKTSTITAERSSAEFIAEAPCCTASGGILPLANFGVVSFGKDSTSVTATCFATISGTTGPISSFSSSSIHEITMETSGGTIKAQPSALSSDGTSFTITWHFA